MKKKTKFLLLGWDSADWKVINPLIDQGKMPALESIINKGVMGNIATLDPPLSPMLWTSISTGKYAYKHGVHGFIEAADGGNKISPITQKSIKTSTIWDMLNEKGYKTNVVGWWPSHPAKDINGVQVSNFFGKSNNDSKWYDWSAAKNSVSPKSLEEILNKLRVHPGELNHHHLASFIEDMMLLEESDSKLVNLLISDLAECVSIHSAATYLAENTEWDFMAVYYNSIDHLSHIFMKYHPPKVDWVDEKQYEKFKFVINGIYQFHDLMLERWLELVDDDCYVMVLSDHGFHSDEKRTNVLPNEPAAIAREHNYLGMIAMKGPNIKQDEIIYGSSLLDICPTILSIYDLPIGADMDGKVLGNIYENAKVENFVKSWDKENTQQNLALTNAESSELIQQLVDLGYLENNNFDSPAEVKRILDENNFYLARSYFEANKFKEATLILKRLTSDYPKNIRYLNLLAESYAEQKQSDYLDEVIKNLEDIVGHNKPFVLLQKGKSAFLRNDFKSAISYFNQINQNSKKKKPYIEYQLANCYLKLKEYKKAVKHFKSNLAINQSSPYALQGLGMSYIALKDYENAADVLIDSISIRYFNPSAHYFLGEALFNLKNYEPAANAYSVALQQAPRMSKARAAIIDIYKNYLPNEEIVAQLEEEFESKYEGEIVLVSGMPRSGTSLMMQVLESCDLEIFTDKKRGADINNPKGYYEHEAVKNLAIDNRIIKEANNKVVKVISPLLPYLPLHYKYKVIVMKRPMHHIVQSQEKMILNMNKKPLTVFDMEEKLNNSYNQTLDYLKKHLNFSFIEVDFEELIREPAKVQGELFNFLEIDKDIDIKNNIDISLFRNK